MNTYHKQCDIESAASFYSGDLSHAGILDGLFHCRKVRLLEVAPKECPQTFI